MLGPDGIDSAGISTLREIGAALDRFKQAGKHVIAVSDGMTQGQYYLAAHANRILLHPDSMEGVLLTGFASYRSYFKDALDWLGVDVHLFRVGEYKSVCGTVYPQRRLARGQASRPVLDERRVGRLPRRIAARASSRSAKVIAAQIDDYADAIKAAGGDMAKLALDNKLVDQLATRGPGRSPC